jgi:hypothetical protein
MFAGAYVRDLVHQRKQNASMNFTAKVGIGGYHQLGDGGL